MNKKAILVVRVSTNIQDYTPQIEDLKKYAINKGYSIFHTIETKESGLVDLENKVGGNEMFKFFQQNSDFDTVFVTEISRLGRRESVLHSMKEWFVKNKVQLYVKDKDFKLFDTDGRVTAEGGLLFTLYGYFAESEIQQKKERFERARRSLWEKGLSIGGKTLFGYEKVLLESKKTTLKINEENAEIIRTIFNWYIHGISKSNRNPSIKDITLECIKRGFHNYTHSKRNVNKLLKEEGYCGFKVTNNKRKNPNFNTNKNMDKYLVSNYKIKYPIIIEKQLFEAVQKKLKENNTKSEKSNIHCTILAKTIQCPKCNCYLNANYRMYKGQNKGAYRCSSRTSAKPCGFKQSISMNLLDSAIWTLIKSDLKGLSSKINEFNPDTNINAIESQIKNFDLRKDDIEKEISTIKNSIKNLSTHKNINLSDLIEDFDKRLKKLDKELGKIEREKALLHSNLLLNTKNQENIYSIVSDNLKEIEKSKQLLKKYTNNFVKNIFIELHNVSFSVLRVEFDFYSKLIPVLPNYLQGGTLDNVVYLILDKRVTRDIKLAKYISFTKVEFSKDGLKDVLNRISFDEIFDLKSPKIEQLEVIPFQKLELD